MKTLCAFVGVAAILLAGCSSKGHPAAKYTTKPGVNASDLARHVKGCAGVAALTDVLPAATSGATCTLSGHTVEFYAWATKGKHPLSSINATGGSAYAWGEGWSAILGETAAYGTFYATARVVADALNGAISS